jgi:hypothetical protein
VTANVFFIGVRRRDGLWLQLLTLTFVPWTDGGRNLLLLAAVLQYNVREKSIGWGWKKNQLSGRPSIHPLLYFFCRGAVVDWAMLRVRDYSSRIHHQWLKAFSCRSGWRAGFVSLAITRIKRRQTEGRGKREVDGTLMSNDFFFGVEGKAISSFSCRLYLGCSFISYF